MSDHRFSLYRPHPWHGLSAGAQAPARVNVYVEITPFDTVKYEVDKESGYLRVDRPQRLSSVPPTLYGFVPRTYCGGRVAALSPECERGDGDPLDICVLSERPINRSEVLLEAQVVGGLRTTDGAEADDKIVAVLVNDPIWHAARDVSELPGALVERLRHYFGTYKMRPGEESKVHVLGVYGQGQAWRVVTAAMADYEERFDVEEHGWPEGQAGG
jgi:inorganic pyrophosphatase